jgi:hypothetical protein
LRCKYQRTKEVRKDERQEKKLKKKTVRTKRKKGWKQTNCKINLKQGRKEG